MKPNYLLLTLSVVVMQCAFNACGQAIVQIASGGGVSFFVKSDGSLWRGDFAHKVTQFRDLMNRAPQDAEAAKQLREMGSHMTSGNFEPVDLIVSNGVTAVALNGQHDTFFIKDDGSLWAMGNNQGGYLGDGTFDSSDHPIQIVPNGVTAVACGESFTIFLKNDGSVWGFGWSSSGALGFGEGADVVMQPKQIIAGGIESIAAGYDHILFKKSDGSLWGMGNNGYGQLGMGEKNKESNHSYFPQPVQIAASNVVSMAAAHYQSFFIKSDGSLWAMGLNDFGQIGDCTIDWVYHPKQIVSDNVVAVTAGESGTLFLKKDGSLWAMGINWGTDYGEGIEFGVESDAKCPTQIFAPNKSAIVAGYYYNAQLKTYVNIWAGKFNNSLAGVSSANNKSGLHQSMTASLPESNLIAIELLKDGDVRITYSGNADVKYALERSSSLGNPNWVSLVTNTAPSGGVLVFTNTPDTTMNNFWRIRSVQ
jgi:alpha-tubulin suppressor-like RCC1 family protein